MKFIWRFACDNRKQIMKYSSVGISAAIIDFSVLYILTEYFKLYYLLSATISFILAAFFNYNLNRRWTFRSSGNQNKQLPVFFIIAILGILLNNHIMYIGVEKFGLWYIYAKIISTTIVTFWNFFGNKYLTFKIK